MTTNKTGDNLILPPALPTSAAPASVASSNPAPDLPPLWMLHDAARRSVLAAIVGAMPPVMGLLVVREVLRYLRALAVLCVCSDEVLASSTAAVVLCQHVTDINPVADFYRDQILLALVGFGGSNLVRGPLDEAIEPEHVRYAQKLARGMLRDLRGGHPTRASSSTSIKPRPGEKPTGQVALLVSIIKSVPSKHRDAFCGVLEAFATAVLDGTLASSEASTRLVNAAIDESELTRDRTETQPQFSAAIGAAWNVGHEELVDLVPFGGARDNVLFGVQLIREAIGFVCAGSAK